MGIVNNKILLKALKAMDMRFHWLRCRWMQKMFRFYWRPGPTNQGDYPSKQHNGAHHRAMHPEFLTPSKYLEEFKAKIVKIGEEEQSEVTTQ